MNEIKEKKIGRFEIETNKIRVSDPCYEKECKYNGVIENVKDGTWKAKIVVFDEGDDWGHRIGYLVCSHEDYIVDVQDSRGGWIREGFEVGVDSGQVAIVDDKYFKDNEVVKNTHRIGGDNNWPIAEDEPWYSICCDRTLSKDSAGLIPFGAVSSSGYGDGVYDCYSLTKDGKIVAVYVDFGLENEENEEGEED